jgi:hypothetical protein
MNKPHWRVEELKRFANDIDWLDANDARCAYDLVRLYDSTTHLGLNRSTVSSIERLAFDDYVPAATKWLRGRLPATQELVVVFGGDDSFRCSGAFFIANWPDILFRRAMTLSSTRRKVP